MDKWISLLLVLVSLMALLHASLIYQRSYYLESKDRIDLERLIDNIDELEASKLRDLSRRLVTISRSDFGILLILNKEFRNSLLFLGVSLLACMLMLGWILLKPQIFRLLTKSRSD